MAPRNTAGRITPVAWADTARVAARTIRPTAPRPMPDLSRRRFLASAAAVGALPFVAACGGQAVDSTACAGYSDLSELELEKRAALDYVDESPKMGVKCTNCKLYSPAPEGSACGGCTLFAGPVAPGGWCSGWMAG